MQVQRKKHCQNFFTQYLGLARAAQLYRTVHCCRVIMKDENAKRCIMQQNDSTSDRVLESYHLLSDISNGNSTKINSTIPKYQMQIRRQRKLSEL